jgi:hypothetical protein
MPPANTKEYIKEKLKKLGYILVSDVYINNKEPIEIKCQEEIHPIMKHSYNKFINKKLTCKFCTGNMNIDEEICRMIMQILFPNEIFKNSRLQCMGGLELDGYNEKLNLAFEYNGKQHYHHITFYHKDVESFNKQLERDKQKIELCKQNKINLITIPYNVHKMVDKFNFIKKELKDLNILFDDTITINEHEIIATIGSHNTMLQECIDFAESKGGKCLSDKYLGYDQELKFVCERNHHFTSTKKRINNERFCRDCQYEDMRNTYDEALEKIHAFGYTECILEKDGYKTEYANNKTPMWVICPKKHPPIQVSLTNMKKGTCKFCGDEKIAANIKKLKDRKELRLKNEAEGKIIKTKKQPRKNKKQSI